MAGCHQVVDRGGHPDLRNVEWLERGQRRGDRDVHRRIGHSGPEIHNLTYFGDKVDPSRRSSSVDLQCRQSVVVTVCCCCCCCCCCRGAVLRGGVSTGLGDVPHGWPGRQRRP